MTNQNESLTIDKEQLIEFAKAALDDYKKEPKRMVLIHNNGDGKHQQRRSFKPNRNSPCPCGSGTKFKKCHGGINRKFPEYPKEKP